MMPLKLLRYIKELLIRLKISLISMIFPPPSFLATMEEYICAAPCLSSVPNKNLEYQEKNLITCKEEDESAAPEVEEVKEENEESGQAEELQIINQAEAPQESAVADLLSLQEINPIAAEIKHNNALALAIIQPGNM